MIEQEQKGNKREMEAVVIKNKMQKTVVVQIKRVVKDVQFKKYHTIKMKYKAHDQKSECQIGDVVLIRQSKPISKEKRWAVVKVLQRAAA